MDTWRHLLLGRWLAEIEDIRLKSNNIQGKLSGHIKRNVLKLKEIVHSLVGKAEAAGDPLFLRMRNSELSQQLSEAKLMRERNKKEIAEANKRIKDLQAQCGPMGTRKGISEKFGKRNEAEKETEGTEEENIMEIEMANANEAEEETV